jgi:hypothetical protein
MTRIIAFVSTLLMLPAQYYQAWTEVEGSSRTVHSYLAAAWPKMLFESSVLWAYCFVLGHALWLLCRIYNKAMRTLA